MAALGPDLEGATVLDLFAGSGALGFEALSRGAERTVFVERARGALDAIRANAKLLGAESEVGLVLAFVPLVECDTCFGVGAAKRNEWDRLSGRPFSPVFSGDIWTCDYCSGRGVITLLRRQTEEPGINKFFKDELKQIITNRQSTPL